MWQKPERLCCLFLAGLFFLLTFSPSCRAAEEGNSGGEPVDRCRIVPVEGYCKGNFTIYYFDQQHGECRELLGCYDTLFASMEDCRQHCEKGSPKSGHGLGSGSSR